MEQFSQQAAQTIIDADLKNIIKKVKEGKTLTQAELARVQSRASGVTDESITTAKNTTELAQVLGVARQSLNRWKKLKDAPKANGNGSYSVVEWRLFIKEKGLQTGNASIDVEALKARKLLAEIEERELKTAILKEEYVSLDLVRTVWTTNVGKAIALMRAKFENELPPILSGMDAISIQGECQAAIDEVCRAIHEGEF
jgi:transcriptional regulator with XRE-family HTH domain